jgi:hypothetical protein
MCPFIYERKSNKIGRGRLERSRSCRRKRRDGRGTYDRRTEDRERRRSWQKIE